MEKEILLSVKDIKKWFAIDEKIFGKPTSFVKAVDGVSFDIYKGEVLGLVGERLRKNDHRPFHSRTYEANLRKHCF